MPPAINILIIEDSAVDAELILFMLSEAGYQVHYGLIDSASDMRNKLKEESWDLMFCDYSLPNFDPFMALEIIKEFDIDIPLIMISGNVGEEKVIELMRAGYHDCIMKNNLSKLPEVVSREIKEAAVRTENKLLIKKLQKYQIFADESNDTILFISVEGNILEVNQAAVLNYGYSRDEFLSMSVFDLRGDEDEEIIRPQLMKAAEEGIVFEATHYRKDRTKICVEVNSHGSYIEGKRVLLSVIRDITKRKQIEDALLKSEQEFRTLVDNAPDMIVRFDRVCRPVYLNEKAQTVFGILTDLLMFRPISEWAMSNSEIQKFEEAIQWVFKEKREKTIEISLEGLDKANYYSVIIVPEISQNGDVETALSISRSITDTVLAEQIMVASLEKYKNLLNGTVTALSAVMEVRDPYTSGHQTRVSKLAVEIAIKLGLQEEELEIIRITGLLHDIGKIYVPAEMLVKPTRLSELEFSLIKVHSEAGYNILKFVNFIGPIAEIVYQHHEKIDGSGYPRSLKGDQIVLAARIICIADVVEAMMSHRPYRPANSLEDALLEIERGAGKEYDLACVNACVRLFRDEGYTL